MPNKYFPWGIAVGRSFLGRKTELLHLKNNISRGNHSLLLSPKRYGKTSLARQVIHQSNLPWAEIDLFIASDEFAIEKKFIKGVQSIISQVGSPDKWFKVVYDFFKRAEKTWVVGMKGMYLEITPEHHNDIPENILEALNVLEHVLAKKNQQAIIFMDEFQEIAEIKINVAIEGAIRHFAQAAKHVVFIFSGSSRHMLKHMFSDKTRPLYALCDEIKLERLQPEIYAPYLDKLAIKTWQKKLDVSAFARIMELTECHPRYVYQLCTCVWENSSESKKAPSSKSVDAMWAMMVQDKSSDVRELLNNRATSQIKLLSLIAKDEKQAMTSQVVQMKLQVSGSAITQALQALDKDDYIEKLSDASYRIIDPMVKSVLLEYEDR